MKSLVPALCPVCTRLQRSHECSYPKQLPPAWAKRHRLLSLSMQTPALQRQPSNTVAPMPSWEQTAPAPAAAKDAFYMVAVEL